MSENPIPILVILGSDAVARRINETLAAAPIAQQFKVTHCPSFSNWLDTLSEGPFGAVIYVEAVKGEGAIEQIIAIRQRMLLTPLFVVVRAEGTVDLDLVRSGADDLLTTRELAPLKLARSILIGMERKRREAETVDLAKIIAADDEAGERAAVREFNDIIALMGEKPLPVTSKAYSASDFSEHDPKRFEEFVQIYAKLIDDALDEAAHRTNTAYRDSLAVFADKIGMLNLGPRDIIDIHKEVISRKTRDANRTKMQAYISEGRLLLVQLMGNVLGFYRSFFWGCRVLAAQATRKKADQSRLTSVKAEKFSQNQ